MIEHRTYVYEGDYGNRKTEADFIKHALRVFDKDTLTGCGVFANNNIYNLQLFIHFTFEKDFQVFEWFVEESYKAFSRRYNVFSGSMMDDMANRAGNLATFTDANSVDVIMEHTPNSTFLWPTKRVIEQKWSHFLTPIQLNVFLSHKSSDKPIAREIRSFLSASEVSVWFDEEEILPGMSIVDSISSGLSRSKGCIALISVDFLSSAAKWTKMEINYFVNLIGGGGDSYIIPVLLDVGYKQLPPFLQDIRCLTYGEADWGRKLLAAIKKLSHPKSLV